MGCPFSLLGLMIPGYPACNPSFCFWLYIIETQLFAVWFQTSFLRSYSRIASVDLSSFDGNEMNIIRTMKLHDCGCGGIPQVCYGMINNLEFTVVCEACGNQTFVCENLIEAIAIWNRTFWHLLPPYELESA